MNDTPTVIWLVRMFDSLAHQASTLAAEAESGVTIGSEKLRQMASVAWRAADALAGDPQHEDASKPGLADRADSDE